MREIVITSEHLERITAHCAACYPHEACGILSGIANRVLKVYPMTNIEPSSVSYYMDPGEQFRIMKEMREAGQGMVGIFHSHPQSPAVPSPKDIHLAAYDDAIYLIVGMNAGMVEEIRAFSIRNTVVADVVVTITD